MPLDGDLNTSQLNEFYESPIDRTLDDEIEAYEGWCYLNSRDIELPESLDEYRDREGVDSNVIEEIAVALLIDGPQDVKTGEERLASGPNGTISLECDGTDSWLEGNELIDHLVNQHHRNRGLVEGVGDEDHLNAILNGDHGKGWVTPNSGQNGVTASDTMYNDGMNQILPRMIQKYHDRKGKDICWECDEIVNEGEKGYITVEDGTPQPIHKNEFNPRKHQLATVQSTMYPEMINKEDQAALDYHAYCKQEGVAPDRAHSLELYKDDRDPSDNEVNAITRAFQPSAYSSKEAKKPSCPACGYSDLKDLPLFSNPTYECKNCKTISDEQELVLPEGSIHPEVHDKIQKTRERWPLSSKEQETAEFSIAGDDLNIKADIDNAKDFGDWPHDDSNVELHESELDPNDGPDGNYKAKLKINYDPYQHSADDVHKHVENLGYPVTKVGGLPKVTSQAETDDGVMIALRPDNDSLLNSLLIDEDGAEPYDNLHITLLYLGKVTDIPDHQELIDTVTEWAQNEDVFTGNVSGYGTFQNGEENVFFAGWDVPDLHAARARLEGALASIGVVSPSEHGFQPHMTLMYGLPDGMPLLPDEAKQTIDFPEVAVVLGPDWNWVTLGPISDGSEEEVPEDEV